MAIVYPRDLPFYELSECTFDLVDGVKAAPYAGGTLVNRSQVDDPVWRAKIRSPKLLPHEEQVWSGWAKSLRGGLKTFVAYDQKRSRPFAYRHLATPAAISAGWNGTGSVTATGAGGAVTVGGVPAGYQAKIGDRLGVEQNGKRGYFELLEDAIASAGGSFSNTLSPFVPVIDATNTLLFSAGAVARIWQPKAEFVIDWRTWQQPGTRVTEVSFEAWQVL